MAPVGQITRHAFVVELRQTRTVQDRVPKGVRVRLPLGVLQLINKRKERALSMNLVDGFRNRFKKSVAVKAAGIVGVVVLLGAWGQMPACAPVLESTFENRRVNPESMTQAVSGDAGWVQLDVLCQDGSGNQRWRTGNPQWYPGGYAGGLSGSWYFSTSCFHLWEGPHWDAITSIGSSWEG